MPVIRPFSDLRNNSNELENEQLQSKLDLYSKLVEVEEDIANGDEGKDFFQFASELSGKVHGAV